MDFSESCFDFLLNFLVISTDKIEKLNYMNLAVVAVELFPLKFLVIRISLCFALFLHSIE